MPDTNQLDIDSADGNYSKSPQNEIEETKSEGLAEGESYDLAVALTDDELKDIQKNAPLSPQSPIPRAVSSTTNDTSDKDAILAAQITSSPE